MATIEERLAISHSHVDLFERRVEYSLKLTQTPNMIAIRVEIEQLYTEMRATVSIPLVIPIIVDALEVITLFAHDSPVRASGKSCYDYDDDIPLN